MVDNALVPCQPRKTANSWYEPVHIESFPVAEMPEILKQALADS